ncbi:5'-methylthioadenosine/S-adenosylhomocysteine nucleosidase [Aerococcus viridans]|uniref:5'-methylthioadenosine/S-adenosylhomocysteine nucleosidase n=1 Tax=Aerococcus viridans TaxID=1377 RepID=UPI003AA919AC
MRIAVVAAMEEELAPFRNFYASTVIWQKGKTIIEKVHEDLYLVASGIGKANAAATAAWVCQQLSIDLLVNTGSIGSFRKELPLGSIVFTDRFVYSDVDATGFDYAYGQVPQMPADYPVSETILAIIKQVLAQNKISAFQGTIGTADSFMSDELAVSTIKQAFPSLTASDMESCALAQIASFYEIPVINVRGISDHVGEHAPVTFDNNLQLAANQAFHAVHSLIDFWQQEPN